MNVRAGFAVMITCHSKTLKQRVVFFRVMNGMTKTSTFRTALSSVHGRGVKRAGPGEDSERHTHTAVTLREMCIITRSDYSGDKMLTVSRVSRA